MARLRVLSGREVCAILAAEGFSEVRRRGSHFVMQRAEGGDTTAVPKWRDGRELRTGMLMSIIRQSGLARRFFE